MIVVVLINILPIHFTDDSIKKGKSEILDMELADDSSGSDDSESGSGASSQQPLRKKKGHRKGKRDGKRVGKREASLA